jgi:hypothetical protein
VTDRSHDVQIRGVPPGDPMTVPPPPPVAVPRWAAPACVAMVVAGGVLAGLKGIHSVVLPYGLPFWQVTYSSGPMRRALVGTVFQALYGSLDAGQQSRLIIETTVTVALAIIVGVAIWLGLLVQYAQTRAQAVWIVLVAMPIVCSSLFTTLVFETGYMDGLLVLVALVCAMLLARRHYWPACALAAAAPFVHEMFIYLWVPVAVFGVALAVRGSTVRRVAARVGGLAVPFVSEAVVVLGSSRAAAAEQIRLNVTGSPTFKAGLLNYQYTQTLGSALHSMQWLQADYWWPTEPLAVLYFCWPAIVAVTAYMILRHRALDWLTRTALVSALVSPWLMVAVASDMSRLLVLANATTVIVILGLESTIGHGPIRRASPAWIAVFAALTVLALETPFVYAWLNTSNEYSNGPVRSVLTPLVNPLLKQYMHLR